MGSLSNPASILEILLELQGLGELLRLPRQMPAEEILPHPPPLAQAPLGDT